MKLTVPRLRVYYFLVLFTIFSIFQLRAQTISSISGRVVHPNKEPIAGNILVLSVSDSSIIRGIAFTDSIFRINNIQQKEVLLKFSALSMADTLIKVSYVGSPTIDLGIITLSLYRKELNEITVLSKAPFVKYNSNGTVELTVANTILAASSSVMEILSKSPGVQENNGQVSVFGKGEAMIYLNGKQITNERLYSIPVSQIQKIEIINNPGSKYDAEGKAVINIITKSKITEGILGSFSQQLTYSSFAGTNTQSLLDLSYGKKNLSIVGNYSILTGKNREFLHTIRTRPDLSEYLRSDLTTDWRRLLKNYSNYGLGIQYTISPRKTLSLAYSGYQEKLGGYTKSRNNILTNSDTSLYTSLIDKAEKRANSSFIVNYNQNIDSLGSILFVGAQYSWFSSGIADFITENRNINGTSGIRYLENTVDHNIGVLSVQADFTKILRNRRKLEMGIKVSDVTTSSATDFSISENGGAFVKDNILSNNFKYLERIPAAYFSLSGLVKSINYTAGLRSEWTDYQLTTSVGGGQVIRDQYFNVFPSLQLSTAISKKTKIRLSYTSKITRPRYQALNPFVIYQDPFTTIEGNPNLIPEKVHAFELGTNFLQYDIRVGYNYTIDPLNAAALRGTAPNSFVLKGINLKDGHSYFVSIGRTFTKKWLSSVNTINLSYNKLNDDRYEFILVEPNFQPYLYSNNTFNVKNLLKIQVLGWYNGRRKLGLYDEYKRWLISVGLEKDFFTNTFKVRVMANDIFAKTNASGVYSVGKANIFYNRTFNNAYYRVILTWNFGKLKKLDYRIKSTGQVENSRAN